LSRSFLDLQRIVMREAIELPADIPMVGGEA
jgi:hypothetical protein